MGGLEETLGIKISWEEKDHVSLPTGMITVLHTVLRDGHLPPFPSQPVTNLQSYLFQ